MKQNGKGRPRFVVAPALPAQITDVEWRTRLTALDERLASVNAAVDYLVQALEAMAPLRDALAAAAGAPTSAATGASAGENHADEDGRDEAQVSAESEPAEPADEAEAEAIALVETGEDDGSPSPPTEALEAAVAAEAGATEATEAISATDEAEEETEEAAELEADHGDDSADAEAEDPGRPLTPEELRRLVAEFRDGRAQDPDIHTAPDDGAGVTGTVAEAPEVEAAVAAPEVPVDADDDGAPLSQEEVSRLVAQFREGKPAETPPEREPEEVTEVVERRLHGLARVPIRVSIEDKRNGVTLVPLHRALLSIPGVKEASLVSYASGKIIVSVVAEGELEASVVERALSRVLGRRCEIAFRDDTNLFVRMSED